MKFKTSFGDGIFFHSLTPKEPLLQSMCHRLYAAKTIPTILAKFFLYAEAIQVCGNTSNTLVSAFCGFQSLPTFLVAKKLRICYK